MDHLLARVSRQRARGPRCRAGVGCKRCTAARAVVSSPSC